MLRAHEHRRVALRVVQQPAGILHEALRVALVPAHFLGAEGLGLGKELDTRLFRRPDYGQSVHAICLTISVQELDLCPRLSPTMG